MDTFKFCEAKVFGKKRSVWEDREAKRKRHDTVTQHLNRFAVMLF